MESVNPTIDPEAQRAYSSDGQRSGMYISNLDQEVLFSFTH